MTSWLPGQIGLVNVTLGKSSNPATEAEVLSEVASYGRQLGRIEDAIVVLLKYFESDLKPKLNKDEARAIDDLKCMLKAVADVRDRRSNPHYASL